MSRILAALALAVSVACTTPSPRSDGSRPPAGGVAADRWWNGAVFYEVFVRSCQDSDGDGIGDLKGLAARLDYLDDGDAATTSDLGVDALWLMPVFASPSYHGYDTTDYEKVNPDYGTNADLDALVAAAHRRGMRVIVDLVLNHTSDQHPWFQDAKASPAATHRDWYVWSATDLGWGQPWNAASSTWHRTATGFYYGLFQSHMPDLNFRTAAVRAEAIRVADHWLSKGIDGFRLDAARHLIEDGNGAGQNDTPETHAFWKEFAAEVRRRHPDALLVGEVWADTPVVATYYGSNGAVPGDELSMLFDFKLAEAIVSGVKAGDGARIAAKLEEVRRTYPRGAADAIFLTNHDQRRVASQVGNDRAKLALAAAILLTLPGSPFLYYGEEIGMQNGPGMNDEWKRTPMAWNAFPGGGFTTGKPWYPFAPGQETANVAAEMHDPGSLLSRYRALLRARRASVALRRGDLSSMASGSDAILAFTRRAGGETVVVAHNLGESAASGLPLAVAGTHRAEPIFADAGVALTGASGAYLAVLPPRTTGIWRLR